MAGQVYIDEKQVQKPAEQVDSEANVWVKEPPKKGRATKAVIKAVAEYLNISKSMVNIISGAFSRQKVIEIK